MKEFPQLPLPLRAPHSGTDTSVEAAVLIQEHLGRLEAKVLAAIRGSGVAGLCDHEGAELTRLEQNTYRPRRRSLAMLGLVIDSGLRRNTPSGRKAVVWVASQEGSNA